MPPCHEIARIPGRGYADQTLDLGTGFVFEIRDDIDQFSGRRIPAIQILSFVEWSGGGVGRQFLSREKECPQR